MSEFVLNGMFSTVDLQDYLNGSISESERADALAKLNAGFDGWYRSLAEYDPKIGYTIAEASESERLPLIIQTLNLPSGRDSFIRTVSGEDRSAHGSAPLFPVPDVPDIPGSNAGSPMNSCALLPDFGLTPEKESLIGQISSPAFLEHIREWCRQAGGGAALVLTNEELTRIEEGLKQGWAIDTIGLCDVILRARDSYFHFHDSPDLHRQVQLIGLSESGAPVDLHFLSEKAAEEDAYCIDFTDCLFRFENIRPIMAEPDKVLLLSSFCGLSPEQLPPQVQIAGLRLSRRSDGKYQYLTSDGRVHPIGSFDMALPFANFKTLVWNSASGAAVIDTCGKELSEYPEQFRLHDVVSIRTHFTGSYLLTYRNGTLALWNQSLAALTDGIEQIDDAPSDGRYRIKRLGKWGLFAQDEIPNGKESAFCYDLLYPSDKGFALAGLSSKKGMLLGMLRSDGTLLIPIQYNTVRRLPGGFMCSASRKKNWFDLETYQHFYDKNGKLYTTNGSIWSKGLLRVCGENQNYGFINENGEMVIPCTLTGTVYNFTEEGTALIIRDGVPSYIDTAGNPV
ncbi:MAG: WG repeat-containing protein [Lachnospiraceae bacterium]|nr:WG repeat-containing protein [Lachnospiraceae bacterium]